MSYQPVHLKRWDSRDPATGAFGNYAGETFGEYYCAPVFQHRDSGHLDQSNFAVVLSDLEKHGEGVEVNRTGHWAVGWTETILIHESNDAALQAADKWAKKLADYPVANEDDFSDREYNAACEYWEGMSIRDRADWCKRYRVSIFAARSDLIPDGIEISALAE